MEEKSIENEMNILNTIVFYIKQALKRISSRERKIDSFVLRGNICDLHALHFSYVMLFIEDAHSISMQNTEENAKNQLQRSMHQCISF